MGKAQLDPVRCSGCELLLDESPGLPAEERSPCPSCRSLGRRHSVTINEILAVKSHLSAIQERENQAIGFSESDRGGRTSSAELGVDGLIETLIRGSSPQGEEDTRSACELLLSVLRSAGATFDVVIDGPEPADGVLRDSSNHILDQPVQVVRAVATQSLWRALAQTGEGRVAQLIEEHAAELAAAIQHKATAHSSVQRAEFVLALDATRLPGHSLDAVVKSFRDSRATWASSIGFRAIWLVGPSARLTWRLDAQSDRAA